jgi:hypothetical protein
LASSNIRFGATGAASSIDVNGNLEQPFYRSGSDWRKLTYSSNALDFRAVSGGSVIASSDDSSYRTFTTDTSWFSGTTGTVSVTLTTGDITLVRSYEVASTSSRSMTATITMTNNGASAATASGAWFGTKDDWVGTTDGPRKRTGTLGAGGFTYSSSGGSTLEIASGSEVVYLTSSDAGSVGLIARRGAFSNVCVTTTPLTDVTNDGSYAMFLDFGDIPAGASVSRSLTYAAGTLADVSAIAAEAAAPVVYCPIM